MKTENSIPFISADNMVVGYDKPCVHPISFNITSPGIYAIVGPNGSGKSTFLKTLVGLIPMLSGSFKIAHIEKSAYVPQSHTVNKYFHLSLRDFILQGYGPNCQVTPNEEEKISKYIDEWQLSEQTKKCFHELSGGQKTRAMIVRALVSEPQIIFLDEPLASLDSCCQMQLMQTLFSLVKNNNRFVFIVEHHLDKFTNLITNTLEFIKHHDDPCASMRISSLSHSCKKE